MLNLLLTALLVAMLLGGDGGRSTAEEPRTPLSVVELVKLVTPSVVELRVLDAAGKQLATATGFYVSADGRLVTNKHVIEGASSIVVANGKQERVAIEAVLGESAVSDLVVLKARVTAAPFLELGDWDKVERGSRVVVVGNPLGLESSVSEGIVAAKRKAELGGDQLQISAPISQGSSGSPVLDENGRVIGTVAFYLTRGQNLNFAVGVSDLVNVLKSIGSDAKGRPLKSQLVSPKGWPSSKDGALFDEDFKLANDQVVGGNYAKALQLLRTLSTKYPKSSAVWFQLGLVYSRLEFLDESANAYRNTLQLDSTNHLAWNNLGVVEGRLKNQDDEAKAFRMAIKMKPDYAEAWFNLALALLNQDKRQEAARILDQVLLLEPGHVKAAKIKESFTEASSGKSPPVGWQILNLDGRDYVTAQSIQSFYGFDSLKVEGNQVWLKTKNVILKAAIGSQELFINNIKFILSYPVIEIGGNACVTRLDLVSVLDSVMRPSHIKGVQTFDTVVIDPGHGGSDEGARGKYGFEKEYTLSLGLALMSELESRGFKVVMTRKDDTYLSLANRIQIANDTPSSIFISLKFKSGSDEPSGVTTYPLTQASDKNSALVAQSMALATAVHARVCSTYKIIDNGIMHKGWLLSACKRPGIVFEAGSISNVSEARFIASETFRKALAETIVDGIINLQRATKSPPVKTDAK